MQPSNSKTPMIISLDYELFFGPSAGTPEACLIEPTQALIDALKPFNGKLTLFVDIGYLVKIKSLLNKQPHLKNTYDLVANQLNRLSLSGHDLQLHIHPHWEDTQYKNNMWDFSNTRFRLQDFSREEIADICQRYQSALEEISEQPVFAFRAGGWCLQPFDNILPAFKKLDIWLDSTLFKGGVSHDPSRGYDFRKYPNKTSWRFSTDPTEEDTSGNMLEIPISSLPHSPLLFWKMLWIKKFASNKKLLGSFGDGSVMPQKLSYYIERLTRTTFGPASIDGVKASTLQQAYAYHMKTNSEGYFNVMGHPKSLSKYSIQALAKFLEDKREIDSITFKDLTHLKADQ